MSVQKVYIIEEDDQSAIQKTGTNVVRRGAEHTPGGPIPERPLEAKNMWLLALRSYALGPVSLILWPRGKGRAAWATIGSGSLIVALLLCFWWRAFFDVPDNLDRGTVVGVGSFALTIIMIATAWARTIVMSPRQVRWPAFMRRPGTVGLLGLIFPGLGLFIADRRWKSALAVLCAGVFMASLVVARNGGHILTDTIVGRKGLAPLEWERILLVAAGVALLSGLAWLVLVLDGVRMVSPAARSGLLANRLSLFLLVTIVIFLATFRPVPFARNLELKAEQLQQQGMQIFPLALCELASKLDPGSPAPLTRAAYLYNELGFGEKASVRRRQLRERAVQFAVATATRPALAPPAKTDLPAVDQSGLGMDNLSPVVEWGIIPRFAHSGTPINIVEHK